MFTCHGHGMFSVGWSTRDVVKNVDMNSNESNDLSVDRLAAIEIRVCTKGGACSYCGNPAAVGGGQWATINCQGGPLEGNEIQLTNPRQYLQFCEMKIYGI